MMATPKVYVTRQVHEEAIKLLQEQCSMEVWDSQEAVPRDVLLQNVKGKDALFCTITDQIDEELLEAAGPQLKAVATMSVGTHHINKRACKKRGVEVSCTTDTATDSAAEMTVLLLLMAARRTLEGEQAVKNGEWGLWKPMWICGIEIPGRTLGIVGFGRVGYGVARRMKPFGVSRILYHDVCKESVADDVGGEYVDLETLYKESDFVVLTCALNGATYKMINKKVLDIMKPTAILINTSRGPVVDTDDLVDALNNKKIMAAALDITDPEPLPVDHPLMKMDNCIITPHMGTNSKQARKAMAIDTAKNILGVLKHAK